MLAAWAKPPFRMFWPLIIPFVVLGTTPVVQNERATPGEPGLPVLFDVFFIGGLNGNGNLPQNVLLADSDGRWNTDDLLQPQPNHLYGSAALGLAAEWEVNRWFLLRGTMDSGELRLGETLQPPLSGLTSNARTFEEAAVSSLFVRELSATLLLGGTSTELGRRRLSVGRGLVYDDFGTGVSFSATLESLDLPAWRLRAAALLVGETTDAFVTPSPLLVMRADYELSFVESAGIFGAIYLERGAALHDILASAMAERWLVHGPPRTLCAAHTAQQILGASSLESTCLDFSLDNLFSALEPAAGEIGYLGFDASLLPLEHLSVRATGVLSMGQLSVTLPSGVDARYHLLGYAVDLESHYDLGSTLSWPLDVDVGLTVLILSGDDLPTLDASLQSNYGAFVGVAPYWVWTGLFFSGGLSQGFFAGRATPAGVNGHGVIGVLPSIEIGGEYGFVQAKVAWLRALVPSPPAPLGGQGSTYGIELDITGTVYPGLDWVAIKGELDLFWPGSYFPRGDLAYRALVWLSVAYAT